MAETMESVLDGIDFENTEVAFAYKSMPELLRSYALFRMIDNRWLATVGPHLLAKAMRFGLPISPIVRRTLFAQFCGGESAEQCQSLIDRLWKYKVGTVLDYGNEACLTEGDFDRVAEETLRNIAQAAKSPAIPFCVFKPTGVMRFTLLEKLSKGEALLANEQAELDLAHQRIERICQTAAECNVRVMIDAEETWIQSAIDQICEKLMQRFNKNGAIVYNTLQMYRIDRLSYFKKLIDEAKAKGFHIGVKLVRGAYMEKERERARKLGRPSPIHADKAGTDQAFEKAALLGIDNLAYVEMCVGTHNEHSTAVVIKAMHEKGIRRDDGRVQFSQLLGMSDHLTFNLARQGYLVAKYVPYGPIKEVMPYLMRRAEENTSVQGQSGRELALLEKELVRRRAKTS